MLQARRRIHPINPRAINYEKTTINAFLNFFVEYTRVINFDIFALLYSFVPAVALSAYVPQIYSLARATRPIQSIHIPSWLTWTTTWAISYGYAAFSVHSSLLATTCGINLASHVMIVTITLYKNRKYQPRQLLAQQQPNL